MKYYNRPSWLCSSPELLKCFGNDNIPFGRNVFNTIADLIAQRFDYGDWWKNGKVQVPYGMDIMKRQLYFELGINDSQIDDVVFILCSLSENGIIHFEDRGESVWIEYPDMMKYVDKYNSDTARDIFGKGKTQEEIKEIINSEVELSNDLEVEDKKLINRVDDKKSNKLNSSYTNENKCIEDKSKKPDIEIIEDKERINYSQLTDENISYANDVDICKLYHYYFSELSKSQQVLVEERYQEINDKEESV
ncbi:MAG: hypothetical protein ISQ42_03400 [Flavobacteriaceae bacterium]|nr:hypothetical protein [Flavobacteriaceae bacterium]